MYEVFLSFYLHLLLMREIQIICNFGIWNRTNLRRFSILSFIYYANLEEKSAIYCSTILFCATQVPSDSMIFFMRKSENNNKNSILILLWPYNKLNLFFRAKIYFFQRHSMNFPLNELSRNFQCKRRVHSVHGIKGLVVIWRTLLLVHGIFANE